MMVHQIVRLTGKGAAGVQVSRVASGLQEDDAGTSC
jgi:hypothetical protein